MATNTVIEFTFDNPVILAMPNLFVPRKFKDPVTKKETGDPKFDAKFLISDQRDDYKRFEAQIVAMAQAAFPGVSFAELQFPLQDGGKFADEGKRADPPKDREAFRGWKVITARTQFPPKLGYVANGKIVDIPADEARPMHEPKFYAGVQVLLTVGLDTYKIGPRQIGVNAYLNVVTSGNVGERNAKLGASSAGASVKHSEHLGHFSGVDPTAGAQPQATGGPAITW